MKKSKLAAAALIFSLMSFARPGLAKTVSFGAHFEDESYWASHAIYLARITDVKWPDSTNANSPYVTSFTVIKIISGTPRANNGTIESRPQQHWMDGFKDDQPPGFPERTGTGIELLMSDDLRFNQTTVVKILNFPQDQGLLVILGRIAKLRESPTLQDLLTGAKSEFELMSDYCLKRLSTWPEERIAAEDAKSLQALADESGRPAESRIQAEEDALRFSVSVQSNRDDAEYAWLRGVIEGERHDTKASVDWQGEVDQRYPLIYKLLGLKKEQTKTADYVIELAADKSAPANLREAACSALGGWDTQVFDFEKPDARFERMFEVYLGLLKDENPELRIMGMSMLFDRTLMILNTRAPEGTTKQFTAKAVPALEQALAVETNSRVRVYFESRLSMHRAEEQHPEILEQRRRLENHSPGTNGH